MVVTGIENFYMIDEMYATKHSKPYSRVRHNIKFKYFNRLYGYLDRTSPKELNKVYKVGTDYEIDRALRAINELLYYFEDIEHYEKCNVIKPYSELLIDKKLETLL